MVICDLANRLDTTLVTRVTTLDYRSAREPGKLPPERPQDVFGKLISPTSGWNFAFCL